MSTPGRRVPVAAPRAPARRGLLLGGLALALGRPAVAAEARALRLVVPYPSGGVLDFQARVLAPVLRRALQREVVVDNIAGAAGAIGLQHALGVLDGSEMVFGSDSDAVLAPLFNPGLAYRPEQFQLLAVAGAAPMGLLAGPGFDSAGLAERLAGGARALPELRIASYGVGSNAHLVADAFAAATGIGWLHVPYRGIAPLLQELMGGTVDAAFLPVAAGIADLVRARKLQLFGVAAAGRLAAFAEVPTLAERGLAGFVHRSWSALLAPQALPAPIAERLRQAAAVAVADAQVRATLDASGVAAVPLATAQETDAFFAAEVARYRRLLASAGPSRESAR